MLTETSVHGTEARSLDSLIQARGDLGAWSSARVRMDIVSMARAILKRDGRLSQALDVRFVGQYRNREILTRLPEHHVGQILAKALAALAVANNGLLSVFMMTFADRPCLAIMIPNAAAEGHAPTIASRFDETCRLVQEGGGKCRVDFNDVNPGMLMTIDFGD